MVGRSGEIGGRRRSVGLLFTACGGVLWDGPEHAWNPLNDASVGRRVAERAGLNADDLECLEQQVNNDASGLQIIGRGTMEMSHRWLAQGHASGHSV